MHDHKFDIYIYIRVLRGVNFYLDYIYIYIYWKSISFGFSPGNVIEILLLNWKEGDSAREIVKN